MTENPMPVFLGYLLFFMVYVVIPCAVVFFGYKLLKRLRHGKKIPLDAIEMDKPVTAKQLPSKIIALLNQINEKGMKLNAIFAKDNHTSHETELLVKKVLTKDVPLAISHYEGMVELKGAKAHSVDIKHSSLTAEQSLQDILEKISEELDNILLSEYHNQGQKLLEISRYIDNRFQENKFIE